MISSSTSSQAISRAQSLQNSLTAVSETTESAPVANSLLSQKAVDEFSLRFNAAMVELLSAHGATSENSPLSKRLKAYASGRDAPLRSTLRLA